MLNGILICCTLRSQDHRANLVRVIVCILSLPHSSKALKLKAVTNAKRNKTKRVKQLCSV